MTRSPVRDPEAALPLLAAGEIEVLGLMPYASNATLLALVRDGGRERMVVYKPRRGESPLWDFPRGTLCLREHAAWVIDRALGWRLVPPTVLRDGPAGFGAVQLFIEPDPDVELRELLHARPDDLRRLCLFDLVVNNADRKGGHVFVDHDGRLWGVDHGVCFNAEPKLRTVIWAFEGEDLPVRLLADLERLLGELGRGGLQEELGPLLDAEEAEALARRIEGLLASRRFPAPGPGRHVPWPPW